MENILIPVKNKSAARFLKELINKLGFTSLAITDKESEMMARRMLIKTARKTAKGSFSTEEIQKEIDAVRAGRNGKD